MATTLGSRPSHYDVLGLAPSATSEEVSQAFARKMSLFRARPLADVAQVTAAYETLRNPEKRSEYDRSLQPKPKPKPDPKPEPLGWSFALARPAWKPFIASVPVNPAAVPPQSQPAQASEPHVTAEPEQKAKVDPRLDSIAATLRELARPGFTDTPLAAPAVQPEPIRPEPAPLVEQRWPPEQNPDARLDQILEQIRATGRAERKVLRESEPRWPDWKKPVFVAGGLILGVGMLGGITGVVAGGAAQDSVTVAVPAARPAAKLAAPAAPGFVEAQAEQPAAATRSRIVHMQGLRSLPKPAFAEKDLVDLNPAVAAPPAEAAAENVGDQPVAAAMPASLPLPNNVIARTIDRIGYSCGEVASATQGEAQGVFKVTCSSGESYQATPVRGRYHFRRLGSR